MKRVAILLLAACGAPDSILDPHTGQPPTPGTNAATQLPWVPTDQCTMATPPDQLTVPTDRGLVRGAESAGVVRFLGVPFAQPPVGAQRFRPPTAAGCWEGIRQTTAYAEMCSQRDIISKKLVGSEDCLYLNVWAPKAALTDGRKRAVMFWIYGGGNMMGGTNMQALGDSNLYNGQVLAETHDVVVVSVAYRVGPLGFLAAPALTKESPMHSSGNYGTLDQVAGLSWVQRNIAHFGGDKTRVMVFGESAGAINTCSLVASPLAQGLFAGAIMQSGFCVGIPLAEREALDAATVAKVGCNTAHDVASCMRGLSLETLVEPLSFEMPEGVDPLKLQRMIPAANIDGWVLRKHPLTAITDGEHNRVPIIIGTNADENEIFLLTTTVTSCFDYDNKVAALFPAHQDRVKKLYPCSFFNPKKAFVELYTDSFFTCHARRDARAMAPTMNVWRYYYTYGPTPLGAFHASEIPFVFGSYNKALTSATGEAISNAMMGYWTSMAATGNPNGAGATWERYDPMRDNALRIDATPQPIEHIAAEKCDFWDSITPR